jgi:hypothetical protein
MANQLLLGIQVLLGKFFIRETKVATELLSHPLENAFKLGGHYN